MIDNNLYMLCAAFLLAYLFGSIPFGMLIAKAANIGDLRKKGSGNIGATNVFRLGGKKLGIITFLLDFHKCFIVPIFMQFYLTQDYETVILYCSAFSVIGHMFPIWLKFKGGKGVACMFAMAFITKFWIGIIISALWLITFRISRYSSLSSIFSSLIFLLISISWLTYNQYLPILIIISIIIFKHNGNIIRLIKNTETKF